MKQKTLKIDVSLNDMGTMELFNNFINQKGDLTRLYIEALKLLREHPDLMPDNKIKSKVKQYNCRVPYDLYELLEIHCEKLNRSKKSILLELIQRLHDKKEVA